MAAFEGFKVKLFRTDPAGQTVFLQENGRQVYVVPDDATATGIARFVYTTRQVVVLAMAASFFAIVWHSWTWIGIPLAALLGHLAIRRRAATLPRSPYARADLPPIDRGARRQAYDVALGRRYFWNMIAASVVIGAMVLVALLLPAAQHLGSGRPEESDMLRLGWMALLAWCVVSAVIAMRGLRSIRAAGRGALDGTMAR